MIMKKIKFIIALMVASLAFTVSSQAQNNIEKADDLGRIVLRAHVESSSAIPSFALKVVQNKLTQIASKNGVGGNSLDQRFVITANILEMTRDITPTTPAMIALTLSPTIYIGDAISGELYASCQLPNVKGVGENETKAYMNAVKNINTNNASVAQCINEGKEKIIAYYNSQIDFIIAEAESLAKSGEYDEAMAKLAAVPQVCKDAYVKAVGKIGDVYQQKIDLEGEKYYNEANAQWNTAKTEESAAKVVELLASINPLSKAAEKAKGLVASVESHYAELEARRRELEERQWAFEMQQYKDEQEYRNRQQQMDHAQNMASIKSEAAVAKAALRATQATAAAMASRPVVYNVHRWWY